MDEIFFRGSQKFETLQYKVGVVAEEGKKLTQLCIDNTRNQVVEILNGPHIAQIKVLAERAWQYLQVLGDEFKCKILYHANLRRLIDTFTSKWNNRELCIACVGMLAGGLIGFYIGYTVRQQRTYQHMQAIQCLNYKGIESAVYVEDAIAPTICGYNEVLISVKAGSLQKIDVDICKGYGRVIRGLLYSKHDLPVTLGRDCTGVITDIGSSVKRFEVGDEVWLTVPFWSTGSLSKIVSAPEWKVSKKPTTVGYEGASSLPYAGSLALYSLQEAQLTEEKSNDKRVFIQGGCTPVGCVLIQILRCWGAHITTSCFSRAVPVAMALGANDVIVLSTAEENKAYFSVEDAAGILEKELAVRDTFDVIINTSNCGMSNENFKKYCSKNGFIVSTLHRELLSDTFDTVVAKLYGVYVYFKCVAQKLLNYNISGFGETHMCHAMLEQLTEMVDQGNIKTLVDKVYHPAEIEAALYHVDSIESIGSTIITFR